MAASSPLMDTRDDWDNNERLTEYLATQLMRGQLALLMGAGVSTNFGLPLWDELILRLYGSKRKTPPLKTPELQARDFRTTYFPHDTSGFVDALRKVLYKGVAVDFDSLRKNGTLAAIGSLVMASQRGSASKVITFNWDDLLELFLEYHGFVTSSIGQEIHWVSSVDVAVLHPHGLIPFDPRATATDPEKIVFDQRSFSAIAGNDALPWRQHVLSIMRTHTCLFIGLSGYDQNLDSLLLKCKQEHAIREDGNNTAYWGVTFVEKIDKGDSNAWNEVGVYYKKVSSYSVGLPSFLLGVCQAAVRLRRGF